MTVSSGQAWIHCSDAIRFGQWTCRRPSGWSFALAPEGQVSSAGAEDHGILVPWARRTQGGP